MLSSFGDALCTTAKPAHFATVSEDGLLSVWNTDGGALSQQHPRPTHLAVRWTCVAWWQPEGAAGMLALGSDAGLVVIWDLSLGQIAHELRGHTQHVTDVAFEKEGHILLSTGRDKQVCCWNATSGELVHTFAAGQAAVERVVPTASGNHVLLGSTTIRLVRRDGWKRRGRCRARQPRLVPLRLARRGLARRPRTTAVSLWRGAWRPLGQRCGRVQTLAGRVVQLAFFSPAVLPARRRRRRWSGIRSWS